MAIHDGNILIPFGFQDNTAYLLTIPFTKGVSFGPDDVQDLIAQLSGFKG